MKIHTSLLLALVLSSCASIMTGANSDVTIQSSPPGAWFETNTGVRGVTPKKISVPASQDLLIEFKKEGYETETLALKNRISGWMLGNILFGGLIGLAIDVLNPDAKTHDSNLAIVLTPIQVQAPAIAMEQPVNADQNRADQNPGLPERTIRTSAPAVPREIFISGGNRR